MLIYKWSRMKEYANVLKPEFFNIAILVAFQGLKFFINHQQKCNK
jgi:hypothetical protein